MRKPNTHARIEAVLRGRTVLPPTARPAIGDLFRVGGTVYRLTAVFSTGRGGRALRTYRLVGPHHETFDLTPKER